jgi:hypothetical protein
MNVENDEVLAYGHQMPDGPKFAGGRSFDLRMVRLQAKAPEDWRTPRRWRVGRATLAQWVIHHHEINQSSTISNDIQRIGPKK